MEVKQIKRILALLLAAVMTLVLTGCDSGSRAAHADSSSILATSGDPTQLQALPDQGVTDDATRVMSTLDDRGTTLDRDSTTPSGPAQH